MNKAYITGITGTVAPYLKVELEKNGYKAYDKHIRINDDSDISLSIDYLREVKPNIVFHLAMGSKKWAEALSKYCFDHNIIFVYISTASVFEDNAGGPYRKDTVVTVTNDYGAYKYACENLVRKVNQNAYVLRIGWQISDKADMTSNNMFHFIKDQLDQYGSIHVSTCFYPSVSFLNDTVKAIRTTIENNPADLYLINSNDTLSLYDIIQALKTRFNKEWKIQGNQDLCRNDIMIDERVQIVKLKEIYDLFMLK
ncbi:MAG: sugar nucleotide-binding protein [Acholeplasmataceae bacterium]|nr:sugar nucleotide-binding protein [Acholeplasmataceae bacterium]